MDTDLTALQADLDCAVLLPGMTGYETLRHVWNADIDRHPLAIVRCASAADVAAAVRWCTARGIRITVRGGGHNLAGTAVSDDAVMIDTQLLKSIAIDQVAGTITVGAGCVWGEVDRACEPYGIVVPAGVVSHTGVAGLTLGGGSGYLARMLGSTVDHLQSVQVVTADGVIRTADAEHEPDLFWALRGAGHNFGIATEFVFRYQQLPGLVTVRQALYATADRKAVMRRYRELAVDAPLNVGTYLRLYRCPSYWSPVPAEHRDTQILSLATVTYGDPADEPALTAEIFGAAEPVWTSMRTIKHVTLQHATDDEFRYGVSHYWKHIFVREMSDPAIDVIVDWCDRYPGRVLNAGASMSHQTLCPFETIAGSPVQKDTSGDSTGGLGSKYSANIGADWEYADEKDELVAWARGFAAAMAEHTTGSYVNFASIQGDEETAREIYGPKYERLVQVKHRYDPENVFSKGLVVLAEQPDDLYCSEAFHCCSAQNPVHLDCMI